MIWLKLFFLGQPKVELDGRPVEFETRKALALLVYLALHPLAHSREALAARLWPDYEPERAFHNLRRTLYDLNKSLGKGWLLAGRETIELKRDGLWVDVTTFKDTLSPLRHLNPASPGECQAYLPDLVEATGLSRGEFLAGFSLPDSQEFEDWVFFTREELRQDLAWALEILAACQRQQGEVEHALETTRRWLALDPLHEPAHRQLMTLYDRLGQRPAALRQYEVLAQTLNKELGVQPQPETAELYEKIRRAPVGASTPTHTRPANVEPYSPETIPSNLPGQLTPFIGRRDELDRIGNLLADPTVRLLTLLGPGGIGKTRLAVQAASEHRVDFHDGVYFVSLAPLTDPEGIPLALARSLRFSFYERGSNFYPQLVNHLRGKHMLLILDNFEHLINDRSIEILLDLLAHAPDVKILATSRASLNVRGEQLFPVSGMRAPGNGKAWVDPDEVEDYSAIKLFVQSARRAHPGFELDRQNLPFVARICQLVQGMPLAIELASAWLNLLSPAEIVAEIEKNLDFLETEQRDVPERQRSIRAIFSTSWNMLTPEEQGIFARLSIFQGGFTRQAAQEVAGASLRTLSSLTGKSLLYRRAADRYEPHAMLRQYALEQLQVDAVLWKNTGDHYCAYYARFLADQVEAVSGPSYMAALENMDTESDNLRSAWGLAIDHRNLDQIDKMLLGLHNYLNYRGLYEEVDVQAQKAIELLDRSHLSDWEKLLLAKLLAIQSGAIYDEITGRPARLIQEAMDLVQEAGGEDRLGFWFSIIAREYGNRVNPHRGIELLYQNLERLQHAGDEKGIALTHRLLAPLLIRADNQQAAKAALHSAKDLYNQHRDRLGLAEVYSSLAFIYTQEGDYPEAMRLMQESLRIFEQAGDKPNVGFTLYWFARATIATGDYAEAIRWLEASRAAASELGLQMLVAAIISWESFTTLRWGDSTKARELRQESLAISQEVNDMTGIVWSLWELGEIERVEGNYAEAERLYTESVRLTPDTTLSGIRAFYERGLGDLALARGDFLSARQHFLEAQALAKRDYLTWALAYANTGLSLAAMGLGEHVEAQSLIREALTLALTIGDRPLYSVILTAQAALHAAQDEHLRAIELSTLVAHHPASWQEMRDRAARVLARSVGQVPAQEASLAQARGRLADLDLVMKAILTDN